MKNRIKVTLCKFATIVGLLLLIMILPAAAAGSMPLWAALLLVGAALFLLNTACGVLLAQGTGAAHTEAAQVESKKRIQLHVVRGGRAA